MPAAASKNLMVLLESVLADATTDSPPGRNRRILWILLLSHSYGIRHPAEALRWFRVGVQVMASAKPDEAFCA